MRYKDIKQCFNKTLEWFQEYFIILIRKTFLIKKFLNFLIVIEKYF